MNSSLLKKLILSCLISCSAFAAEDLVQKIANHSTKVRIEYDGVCELVNDKQKVRRYLEDDGGDPNLVDKVDKQSLLEMFAYRGDEAMVDLLIEKCALAYYVDGKGHSALYIASSEGHQRIVEKLINHVLKANGTDILRAMVNYADYRGITALHIASVNGYENIARFLLRYADVDQVDRQGRTALHFACYKGWDEIINVLLDYKASIERESKDGLRARNFFNLGASQEEQKRNPRIISKLEKIERLENRSKKLSEIQSDESLSEFMTTFQRKCGSIFLAYRTLESDAVQGTKDSLCVSNAINLFGSMIPLPGADMIAGAVSTVAGMIEDRMETEKKKMLTELFPTVKSMEEEVEKAACELTIKYKGHIQELTVNGASTLAECGVARFVAYMRDKDTVFAKEKPFEAYVLESVRASNTKGFLDKLRFWQNQDKIETKSTVKLTEEEIFSSPDVMSSTELVNDKPAIQNLPQQQLPVAAPTNVATIVPLKRVPEAEKSKASCGCTCAVS